VPSKANYNLFLGREWIHVVGAIPSTRLQCTSYLMLWDEQRSIEHVEADESIFKGENVGILECWCIVVKHKPLQDKNF